MEEQQSRKYFVQDFTTIINFIVNIIREQKGNTIKLKTLVRYTNGICYHSTRDLLIKSKN